MEPATIEPPAVAVQPAEAVNDASPLVLALVAVGIVALVTGALGAIAGSDRSGIFGFGDDREGVLDQLGLTDAMGDLTGQPPGASDFPPEGVGDAVGSEWEQRDSLQGQFDRTGQATIGSGDDKITISRLSDGTFICNGSSGRGIRIAPSGSAIAASASGESADGQAFVPHVDGEFSGLRVDEFGDVVPVRKGEETSDTLGFRFDETGRLQAIELPGSDEVLRVTSDGADAQGFDRLGFGTGPGAESSPDAALSPDARRDEVQYRLDNEGRAGLSIDAVPVDLVQHASGVLEMVGPNGESVFLSPEFVAPSSEPGATPGNSFAPAADGIFAGFRVDETGQIVPVLRGSETDDMIALGFGSAGVQDLVLPGAEGEALRVAPEGKRSDSSWYGAWSADRKAWMSNPAADQAIGSGQPGAGVGNGSGSGAGSGNGSAGAGQGSAGEAPQSAAPANADSPVADDPAVTEPEETASDVNDAGDEADGGTPWALWLMAGGLASLLAAAGLWLMRRADDDDLPEPVAIEPVESPMVGVVSNLQDSLHATVDPRDAILHAYSELESGLADKTLVRGTHESPKSFLRRTIGSNPEARVPVANLTELFELARFSDYPITEDMRAQAIEAVEQIRRAWQSAEQRRDHDLVTQ